MKVLSIISLFLVLFLVTGCESTTNIQRTNTGNVVDNTEEEITTTSTELAMHNTEQDCWVGYKSKIYDVTEFLQKHPGGANAIIPYCGTSEEFTKAFEGKHGISKIAVLEKEGIYKGDLS